MPRLPRDAWVVLGGDALSAVGSGLTLPFLFVYLTRVRGIELGIAGLAVSTVAVAAIVGNPLSGWLSDRVGARETLMLGLVVAAVGCVLIAMVREPWQAFVATGVEGFGAAIIWPSQDALLAGLVGPGRRSEVFSVRFATLNAGFGVGALVAAGIVDVSRPGTFVFIYLVDAASFLAFVPVLLTIRVPKQRSEDATAERGGYRQILRDRVFLRLWVLTALLVAVGYGQYHSGFPGYATRPGGITVRALGVAFAANTFAVVLAQLFVLRALSGRRRTRAIALVALAWACAWGITLIGGALGRGTDAVVAFAAAMVVFAVGETMLSPALSPMVNDLAPDRLRGHYNGLSTLAWTTGFMIGPAVAGVVLGTGTPGLLFLGLIGGCAVVALGALRLERHLTPAANRIGGAAERGEEAGPAKAQLLPLGEEP
ncbi:MAG: MFS transporter [Actinomycetota bacterium]|nr:MFS transporter [Actinomycetota bacterium]